jgi:hypothetical protein
MSARTPPEESRTWSKALLHVFMFVGGLAIYLLIGYILWRLLDNYIQPRSSTEKKDLVQALGLIMAGVAGAIGIYFTWRGQRLTQESLESTRQLTREGQITERFTRAIDQLGATDNDGHKSLEIRLGGIYALERIAKESPEDHWPIMEILTTYVREHAPWNPEVESSKEGAIEDILPEEHPLPDPDIQAILTVIGRRIRYLGHGEPAPLDLRGTGLRRSSGLRQAHLERANLQGADLSEANLQGAFLRETDLTGAKLWNTNLREADLSRARLSHANLKGAYLARARLPQANLIGGLLEGAHLFQADLLGADLTDAILVGANLGSADLRVANLRRANLSKANLESAHLRDAGLQGAVLRGATLSQEQIATAHGDRNTQPPEHLEAPASWSKKIR